MNSENLGSHNWETKREPEGITEIRVGGFKSIVKTQAIEVRPLTLLSGANSSGKSSALQPLLLLKQTLEAPFDPPPLRLDGPNVKFTSGLQFLSRVSGQAQADHFEVGLRAGSDKGVVVEFSHEKERGFEIQQNTFWLEGQERVIREDSTAEEVRALLQLPPSAEVVVVSDRCFLRIEMKNGSGNSVYTPGYGLAPLISGLIHVPGLRGSPERIYPQTSIGPTFSGPFDNYVSGLVDRWQTANVWQRLTKLNNQLEHVGVARGVQSRRISEAEIELQVDRIPTGSHSSPDFVNIADVGSGVRTALPVLVALLVAQPGQAVYIEEPESHLHPRAQVNLAAVLADAAKGGVRVIAETHSSLVLRAVQTLVAKGQLDPKLVKLHWFTRNEEDGSTEVRSADLDENGAFGEWPSDFDDIAIRSEGDYLDAVGLRSKS